MSSKTASARPGHDRASLYDEITGKIIAELEAGRVPWVQPWGTAAAKAPLAMPKNAATGRQYSGINVLILWGAVIEHGFPAQSWLTFRQALSLGGNVRKGEHGTTVVYADRFVPDDEKRRAPRDRRGSRRDPVPEAVHRLQRRPMRKPAGRGRGRRATAAAGPDRAQGRGADPGDRRRLPHRRQPRLLRAGPGLRHGPAAAGLFRADQLAPHGPARAGARQRPSVPSRPRSQRHVRHARSMRSRSWWRR